MTDIVEQGRASGQFAAVDPMLLYLTTIWPIVVYLATAPIRTAVARVANVDVHRLDPRPLHPAHADAHRRALMPAPADPEPTGERS